MVILPLYLPTASRAAASLHQQSEPQHLLPDPPASHPTFAYNGGRGPGRAAGLDTHATHASADARTYAVTCEPAAFLLVEFDAVMDARTALLVTAGDGSVVAQLTGAPRTQPH